MHVLVLSIIACFENFKLDIADVLIDSGLALHDAAICEIEVSLSKFAIRLDVNYLVQGINKFNQWQLKILYRDLPSSLKGFARVDYF